MPGCVLRVGGQFAPGEFLQRYPLPGVTRCEHGILLVLVSEREAVSAQTEDAVAFLKKHEAALAALMAWPGVEGRWLDFGLWQSNRFCDSASFPPTLLSVLAAADVRLAVSYYPTESGTDV